MSSKAQPTAALEAGSPELRFALGELRSTLQRALAFGLCSSLLALMPSWYMLEVYDRVVNSRSGLTLLMLTLAVLLAYALIQVQEWTREALLRHVARSFDQRLGGRVFEAALRAIRLRTPGGGPQAAQDLHTVSEFLRSPVVTAAFEAPMVVVFVLLVSAISPWLGVVTVAAAVLQGLIGWCNERATGPALREANRKGYAAHQYADRLLQNAQVVQSMGMLDNVHQRWRQRHQDALADQARASLAAGNWQAVSRLLQNVLSSALLGLSCWLLLHDELNGGGGMLVVSGIFGARALAPFNQLVSQWPTVVNAREAWRRLVDLLAGQPPLAPGMPLPPPQGRLTVERVVAGAPGTSAALLRELNFALAPGEVVAVIGPSGAGKTCLARTLLGLWPASSGKVRLDGVDIGTWPKAELGPHLGYLPQGVELLDGTLADNVARFGTPDPARLQAAIEAAGLHEFVQSLPDGLETCIGPGGARLSGGQRQRVGLARAIYGQPALVVLDEPNASLDEAGDVALAQLIETRKQAGTTFVVITHRTSVLSVADKVLLLVDGQQQAFGPRDEVLAAIQRANQQAQAASAARSGGVPPVSPPAPRVPAKV